MGFGERLFRRIAEAPVREETSTLQRILLPLSLLYQGGVSFRAALYARGVLPSRVLPKPVISVGNLEAGGTGKTPLVIEIVRSLASEGLGFAVLSRGYKGKAPEAVNVVSDRDGILLDPAAAGDEPVLMAGKLPGVPVLVGKDRAALGSEAIRRFDADCLILDDGYQHLPLRRDCNLLLLDGKHPFGNGRCLPSGPLREGISAVRRADLVVLTGPVGGDVNGRIRTLLPGVPIHQVTFAATGLRRYPSQTSEDLSLLRGARVLAFAGIARPERFFRSVQALGAELAARKVFPDHHAFGPADMKGLLGEGKARDVNFWVTTEKDAVRLPKMPEGTPLLTLELGARIDAPDAFFGEIRRLIGVPSGLERLK